jgi:hypothetical protein
MRIKRQLSKYKMNDHYKVLKNEYWNRLQVLKSIGLNYHEHKIFEPKDLKNRKYDISAETFKILVKEF